MAGTVLSAFTFCSLLRLCNLKLQEANQVNTHTYLIIYIK